MLNKSWGFIGGGRITNIILGGFKRANKMPAEITVSDVDADKLNKLQEKYPKITVTENNTQSALMDLVFLAVHPPVVTKVLDEIKSSLKPDSILISLVPNFTIVKLEELLNGFKRILRIIPNAPSIVNSGFNPVTFADVFSEIEKKDLIDMLSILGKCPEVWEEELEAYAILTAMGPAYFWFQWYELQEIGKSFGLNSKDIKEGMLQMLTGALKVMFESDLTPQEVMDLLPVKPLGEDEESIKNIYKKKLEIMFKKLKS